MVDLSGTRVRLRTLTLDDVDALAALADDDSGSFRPGGEEGRARLRRQIERNPTLEDAGFVSLGVEAEGRLIGDVQARAPKNGFPPGTCEIGITLSAAVRGMGYGREAVELLTEHLFAEGLERVQASTALENVAMRRVLERVGYAFEGVLRDYAPAGDSGREDYAMYAATRSSWQERSP